MLRTLKVLGLLTWVFTGFMAAQLLVGVVLGALLDLKVEALTSLNQTALFTTVAAATYILAIAITIGLPALLYKRRTTLKEIGLQGLPRWSDIGWAPVGWVAYMILTATLAAIALVALPFVDASQAQELGFDKPTAQIDYILAFVSLVVLAPVVEEVLFRGYLLAKLRKISPTWVAIIVSSALFGLVHFQWNVGIDTFAMGVVASFLCVKTKSLWPAILIHMIKNGIAFYFLFINTGLLSTLGG